MLTSTLCPTRLDSDLCSSSTTTTTTTARSKKERLPPLIDQPPEQLERPRTCSSRSSPPRVSPTPAPLPSPLRSSTAHLNSTRLRRPFLLLGAARTQLDSTRQLDCTSSDLRHRAPRPHTLHEHLPPRLNAAPLRKKRSEKDQGSSSTIRCSPHSPSRERGGDSDAQRR